MAISVQAALAEFIAMMFFVYICAGAATGVANTEGWIQQVALTFGFCIMVLAYTIGHYSGGQINCAVSFGLALATLMNVDGVHLSVAQAGVNVAAQIFGSLAGAALIALVKGPDSDLTGSLASNTLAPDIGVGEAIVAEIMGTFLLMFCVLETAVNKKSEGNRVNAPIAIGMSVYLCHSVMIPIDGCSINPTRSFGPAVVASIRYSDDSNKIDTIWKDHWVFWLGPLVGAALAVSVYKLMNGAARD